MQFVGGNRLTLLRNGEEYFPALAAAIDAARAEVFLESYIYADDQTGAFVTEALARAAERGVRVHLLVDGFGAREFPQRWRRRLVEAGARVLVFRPELGGWLRLRRGRLRRMHRKLAALDARVAFVGGINVIDDYDLPGDTRPRYDYAIGIEGPLAADVRNAAARLWRQVAWASTRRRPAPVQPFEPTETPGIQKAALVLRDSLRHRHDIEDAYLHYLERARVEVVIACAYFFPGRRFRRVLIAAARRGVRVRLLLQGRIEYPLLHYASRALYGSLLEAGIEIHEYMESFLHAKVAVFDRCVACVGSSNIDPLSLLLAREANVFVDDAAFAMELYRSLEEAMRADSRQLPPRDWHHRPLLERLRTWIGYTIARTLISRFGFERYH
ncbi:MAG TPA: cardiolipin synthase ClsB [Burkholderiales bacterium]|nr:cardiolipin synthase ClsB [Burkholderiales bacterium]